MPDTVTDNRFYGELASWWPLISPVEEYESEATYLQTLLPSTTDRRLTLLELGSGGGSNAYYLKTEFDMALVDLSPQMLEVSKTLNPECEHIQGDMRSLRLGREFDSVFVHDAIDYMISEADLRAALVTAFIHCRPGSTAVFVPDHTREIYAPGCDVGGTDGVDGRSVRFLNWDHDDDPSDDHVETEYAFVMRSADGSVRSVHETHRTGLFGRATWLRLCGEVGFDVRHVVEETDENRVPRDVFIAVRPVDPTA